jgi:hypothetical protein
VGSTNSADDIFGEMNDADDTRNEADRLGPFNPVKKGEYKGNTTEAEALFEPYVQEALGF